MNEAIVAGASNRAIACRFEVGREAVRRHREHIPELLVKASSAEEVAQADILLDEVRRVRDDLRRLCAKAEEDTDYRAAIGGQATLLRYYELLARIGKLIDERPQVNVTATFISLDARRVIVQALEPYPDARQAVADALAEIEGAAS